MEQGHPHSLQRTPDYTHSLRLTFAYSDDTITLARTERVAMIAPAAATPPAASDRTGYWFELRDKDGKLLYYRPLHDPMRESLEVFGDEPGQPIYRVANPKRKGEFDVLLPDLAEGAQFSLHGPKPKARKPHGPSAELLRYGLERLRRDHGGSAGRPEGGGDEDEGGERS